MTSIERINAGFGDPVMDAQKVFRACLKAMSRPGTITPLECGVAAPRPLYDAAAGVLLTLTDFETKVWLDEPARQSTELTDFLRFHTGAVIVDKPSEAGFALITDPLGMPALDQFPLGVPDYPDRSATLIIQTDRLANDNCRFTGPGIDGHIHFTASPLPDVFWQQVELNNQAFPLGVDLVFATRGDIAALPRSAKIDSEGRPCT